MLTTLKKLSSIVVFTFITALNFQSDSCLACSLPFFLFVAVYLILVIPLTSTPLIASSSGIAEAEVAKAPAARAATKLSFTSFILNSLKKYFGIVS